MERSRFRIAPALIVFPPLPVPLRVPTGALGNRRAGRALAGVSRRVVAVVLAVALPASCDDTLQPFRENDDAIFSMFGYLDLHADTQWVRMMPVRQNLFLQPEPIDAVVTLEHLGSGRTVTLNDSIFRFTDEQLAGVAYVHNFWTAERLQPEATYRLTAARSDGASTAAVIVMPQELEIVLMQQSTDPLDGPAQAVLQVRADEVLFGTLVYQMGMLAGVPPDTVPGRPIIIDGHSTFDTRAPGTHGIYFYADTVRRPGLVDVRRLEIRLVAGRSDWPYDPGLSDLEVTLPNTMPSNVENGLGFVGGVATRTIPFDACEPLVPGPDHEELCAILFDAASASIAGRVIREPCGDPHALASIRLTARFADGSAVIREWRTGWWGQYRFEGIEPNAELLLDLGPETTAVQLPPLAAGERYTVEDISVPGGCESFLSYATASSPVLRR